MTQFKISDYETIKNAMVNRDLKQALYDEGKVIMDGVLLTLHGEEHHKRRKLEHKVFQRDYFKYYEHELFPKTLDETIEPFIKSKKADLSGWRKVNRLEKSSSKKVTVSMVGKYTELADAYMSLNEALRHGGLQNRVDVNINYIDSENLKSISQLKGSDAILIPGGFGHRGINGMIMATKYAREKKIPFFGILNLSQ